MYYVIGAIAFFVVARIHYVHTHWRVVRVVDGDTIDVSICRFMCFSKDHRRVRLKDVWAPEKHHKETDRPSGKAITQWLHARLHGRYVRIEWFGTGKYGRDIGVVYDVDGTCWNDRLIEKGYAFATYAEQEKWKEKHIE